MVTDYNHRCKNIDTNGVQDKVNKVVYKNNTNKNDTRIMLIKMIQE